MKVLYRISDGSNKNKLKFDHATKEHCLHNFLQHFPSEEIILYADNVRDETYESLRSLGLSVFRTNNTSNAASVLYVMNEALQYDDSEIVYFVEDDYLHLSNARQVLLEGMERSHYVALYDHPDKYIPEYAGGNPYIESDGGELTKVYLTKSSHWKLTNSTTMTFATTVGVLREDIDVWKKHCAERIPHDFDAFIELRELGRSLITPIPGYATHCEINWAGPLTDWSTI